MDRQDSTMIGITVKNLVSRECYVIGLFAFITAGMLLFVGGYNIDANIPSPCSAKPCHNHGECRLRVIVQPYCKCLPGWTGPKCAEDVNECRRRPTVCNAGICVNNPGSYSCRCPRFYIGQHCDVKDVGALTTYAEDVLRTYTSVMNPIVYSGISTEYLTRVRSISQACFEGTCNITNDIMCRYCESCLSQQYRTIDGRCNDPQNILAGGVEYPFDRSVSLDYAVPDLNNLHTPSARVVSQELLKQGDKFKAHPSGNQLLTYFIQFVLHDFLDNGLNRSDVIRIPIPEEDQIFCSKQKTIDVKRTTQSSMPLDPSVPDGYVEFDNKNTVWWDGSGLYGFNESVQSELRSFRNGKLKLDEDGRLFINKNTKKPLVGHQGGFSAGLYAVHSLFAREHNSICDMLKRNHQDWNDQQIFQVARLIISALSVKITMTEAFPALYPEDPFLRFLAKIFPFGGDLGDLVGNDFVTVLRNARPDMRNDFPPFFGRDEITRPQNYSAAFSQDVVPLLRFHTASLDVVSMKYHNGSLSGSNYTLQDFQGKVLEMKGEYTDADIFYTLGVSRQGLFGLHNTPNSFLNMEVGGKIIDLEAIGILRDRERGLPRYNDMLRAAGLAPKTSFLEIAHGDEDLARLIAQVYNNRVEDVDQAIGLMIDAENDPSHMDPFVTDAISRLLRLVYSDRFYTVDYDEEHYTKEGLEWIKRNHLKSVLLRQYPELMPALDGIKNPFLPWDRKNLQKLLNDEQ